MEQKLDAWLKTYATEGSISPATWEDLPEECKLRLDNFARDEAVRRADEFARDDYLDLSRQDAIRQLVDSMAQAWKLPGDQIRRLVEDFIDELPADPGFEFEKLATRLFRRRPSASWSELKHEIDPKKESAIVTLLVKLMDKDRDRQFNRTTFLESCQDLYDQWTLNQPKDAVDELLKAAKEGDKGDTIPLATLLPLIRQRGASTWARALKLEQEVGVDSATRDDLIRILKRYALIVRREGSLARVVEERETEVQQPVQSEPEPEVEVLETPEDVEPEGEPEVEELGGVEEQAVEETPATEDVEAGAGSSTETEEEEKGEESPGEEVESAEPEVEEEPAVEDSAEEKPEPEETAPTVKDDPLSGPTAEDDSAAESMFGTKNDNVPDVETPEPVSVPDEEVVEASGEDEGAGVDTAREDEEDSQESPNRTYGLGGMGREEENGEEAETPRKRLRDVFSPSPAGDRKDRFANLREGPLRNRIVHQMYDDDETMLDVFLAKLSGAPDWNRAKQFIANEFFRCKLDLHSDLGEKFFLALKESLNDS